MSRVSAIKLAGIIGTSPDDVRALMALAAAEHQRQTGMIAGFCACGCKDVQPTPRACVALGRLVDVATLLDLETK